MMAVPITQCDDVFNWTETVEFTPEAFAQAVRDRSGVFDHQARVIGGKVWFVLPSIRNGILIP